MEHKHTWHAMKATQIAERIKQVCPAAGLTVDDYELYSFIYVEITPGQTCFEFKVEHKSGQTEVIDTYYASGKEAYKLALETKEGKSIYDIVAPEMPYDCRGL